jgi:hypothetical protein
MVSDCFLNIIRGKRVRHNACGPDHAFHAKCHNHINTVTLIETTDGYVFGGFTPVAWDSSGNYKEDTSDRSFLFTMKNPRGSDGLKFALTHPLKAIYCNSGYSRTFGATVS